MPFTPLTTADRNRLRKLQDQFLALRTVQEFIKGYGTKHPLWAGGPTAEQVKTTVCPDHEWMMTQIVNTKSSRY